MIVFPGVLVQTYSEFESRLSELDGIGDGVHVDVMDGVYVPNVSISVEEIGKLPQEIYFEAHLMVNDPENYFVMCSKAGFKRVLVHRDSLALDTYAEMLLIQDRAHDLGMEFYLAFTQSDPVNLHEDLSKFDGLLIMTVVPGFAGQPFINEQLDELKKVRQFVRNIPTEVDGHIDGDTINLVQEAGATSVVSTSYLKGHGRFSNYKVLKGV